MGFGLVGVFVRREAIDGWGAQKKKMPGANRSLLRFMFALCLGAVNSRWGGRAGSAYTRWTLFLLFPYSVDHRFLKLPVIP